MREKTSNTRSGALLDGRNPAPWNFLVDLSRQQLAISAELTSAICCGSEALRRIQQDTAHQASTRYETRAQKLSTSCQPAELMAMQSELLRADLQSAGQYWQQLVAAGLQTQWEMMGSVSHMLDSEKNGGIKSALQAIQTNIAPMASSFYVPSPGTVDDQHRDS